MRLKIMRNGSVKMCIRDRCYGILACLKGLKEQGCNGPVTEALHTLEKHLNQSAHGQEET